MHLDDISNKIAEYRSTFFRNFIIIAIVAVIGGAFGAWYASKSSKVFTALTVFHNEGGATPAPNPLLPNLPTAPIMGSGNEMIGVILSRHLSEVVASQPWIPPKERPSMWERPTSLDTQSIPPHEAQTDSAHVAQNDTTPKNTTEKPKKRFSIGAIALLEDEKTKKLSFFSKGTVKNMPEETRRILGASLIRRNLTIEPNDNGFLEMSFKSPNPFLAQYISELYIQELMEYYRVQKTEKAKEDLAFFTYRADSLQTVLDKLNYSIALHSDRNRFSIQKTTDAKLRELEIRRQVITKMYLTNISAKEDATAKLQQDTPVIQVLDPPVPPFTIKEASLILYAITGFILGGFFITVFCLRKLLVADILFVLQESLREN